MSWDLVTGQVFAIVYCQALAVAVTVTQLIVLNFIADVQTQTVTRNTVEIYKARGDRTKENRDGRRR